MTTITYYCHRCGKHWSYQLPKVSCCVMHAPGECCHYMETEVPGD